MLGIQYVSVVTSHCNSTSTMVYVGALLYQQEILPTNWRYTMIKSIIAAVVATAFTGAAFAAAHTAAPAAPATRAEVKAAGAADTATKDASDKTGMNREGEISPTAENGTTSATAQPSATGSK